MTKRKERDLHQEEFNMIRDEVKEILALEPSKPEDVIARLAFDRDKIVRVIQWLLDNDIVAYTADQRLMLRKNE